MGLTSPKMNGALEAMYDAEISYTGEMVGRFFDYVCSMDLGKTIFIVTADHGELFGEHGLFSHTLIVDDALTHVPLVTHGLDEIEGQTDELVQHVDVIRTLLELAGADTDQMQGIDLRTDVRDEVFVQDQESNFDIYFEFNPEFDTSGFHHGPVTGIRTKEFRCQKSPDKSKLLKLPDESRDVSSEYPEVAKRMDGKLKDWLIEYGTSIEAGKESEFTETMRHQLRDLGYLE